MQKNEKDKTPNQKNRPSRETQQEQTVPAAARRMRFTRKRTPVTGRSRGNRTR